MRGEFSKYFIINLDMGKIIRRKCYYIDNNFLIYIEMTWGGISQDSKY